MKKENEKKFRLENAEQILSYQIRFSQERNSMGKRRFNWVRRCLKHFFEKFIEVNDDTKMALINLEKNIEDTYDKNEKTIEDKADSAKDEESLMKYHVYIDEHKIQLEWKKLEGIIEKKFAIILAQIEDLDKSTK